MPVYCKFSAICVCFLFLTNDFISILPLCIYSSFLFVLLFCVLLYINYFTSCLFFYQLLSLFISIQSLLSILLFISFSFSVHDFCWNLLLPINTTIIKIFFSFIGSLALSQTVKTFQKCITALLDRL